MDLGLVLMVSWALKWIKVVQNLPIPRLLSKFSLPWKRRPFLTTTKENSMLKRLERINTYFYLRGLVSLCLVLAGCLNQEGLEPESSLSEGSFVSISYKYNNVCVSHRCRNETVTINHPAFTQQDAQNICPHRCGEIQRTWNGQWKQNPGVALCMCPVRNHCLDQCLLPEEPESEATPPVAGSQPQASPQRDPASVASSPYQPGSQAPAQQNFTSIQPSVEEEEPQQCHFSGAKYTVEAGPIWGNHEAPSICPGKCSPNGLVWNGHWWTTRWSVMSVCECQEEEHCL